MQNLEDRVQDLTAALEEERQARQAAVEQLQAAELARQEFVSLVTHELRVPMTAIRGYSDLLLKGIMGPLNEMQSNYLGVIRANVERMARMVGDLADINKLEGQKLKVEPKPLVPCEVIEEALRAYKGELEKKSQSLTLHCAADLPAIWGARDHVVRVLSNLLSNAHHYTPEGGHIEVCAEVTSSGMRFTVRDDGIGILENEQVHIGERFFRASDEETRQIPGNGLALHLSRLLIAAQGGVLGFHSQRGAGSAFYFDLPLAP